MIFRKTYTIFSLILILTFISCSDDSSEMELAIFDNGNVLFTDYVDHYLLSTQYKPKKFPTEENLEEIVELKAIEKMAVLEAIEKSIDKDSAYLRISYSNETRLLYQKFMNSKLIDLIITDSLMQKFYDEYSPQYKMKYIMRPIVKTSTPEFIENQSDTIRIAYNDLKAGAEFGSAVKDYSQDVATNKKGGDLGWVIAESMGDHVVRSVMLNLAENSYSEPFRGYGGYYILYKGDKREVERPPFKDVKQRIWKSLYRSRKPYIQDELDKKYLELTQKYNLKIDEARIEDLFYRIGYDVESSKYQNINFGNLTNVELGMEIVKYDGGSILLSDLFSNRKKAPTNKIEFDMRLENISKEHLIAQYAKELSLQEENELPDQLEQMRTSLLRAMLFKYEVQDEVDKEVEELGVQKNIAKRTEIKTRYQTEYEDYLKEKYNFRFVEKNFVNALDFATEKKKEQNLEKSDYE